MSTNTNTGTFLDPDPLWRRTVYRRASLAELLTRAADAIGAQCPRCGAAWHVDRELAAELRERTDDLLCGSGRS